MSKKEDDFFVINVKDIIIFALVLAVLYFLFFQPQKECDVCETCQICETCEEDVSVPLTIEDCQNYAIEEDSKYWRCISEQLKFKYDVGVKKLKDGTVCYYDLDYSYEYCYDARDVDAMFAVVTPPCEKEFLKEEEAFAECLTLIN